MDYTNEMCSVCDIDNKVKKKLIKKYCLGFLIGCILSLVAVLMYVLFCTGPTHFEKKFPDIVHNSWCTLNSDGTIMSIEMDGYDFEESDAWDCINEINDELGLAGSTRDMKTDISEAMEQIMLTWDYYYSTYDEYSGYYYADYPEQRCYEETYSNDKYEVKWTCDIYGDLCFTYILK